MLALLNWGCGFHISANFDPRRWEYRQTERLGSMVTCLSLIERKGVVPSYAGRAIPNGGNSPVISNSVIVLFFGMPAETR